MRIIFGSDHAGFLLRRAVVEHAVSIGHTAIEVGAKSEEPYDYPDAADALVPKILTGEGSFGVLVCGSGIGICIRANRFAGIRAANCWNEESAILARTHNYANVLCLGERLTEKELAIRIFDAFLAGDEDHAERHERRVRELDKPTHPTVT